MKSGFVPKEPKPDELIAGTDRGGELPPDEEFEGDGTIAAENEGGRAGAAAEPTGEPAAG